MKRLLRLLPAAVVLASAGAVAQGSYDPKALARYDVSYSRCEASFPEMKGRRDEAYLSLWRVRPSEKTAAKLADARGSAEYKSERERAAHAAAKASAPAAQKTLDQQCRGLFGEMARMPKLGQ